MRKKKRQRRLWALIIALVIILGGLGAYFYHQVTTPKTTTVKLGLVGTDSEPVWNNVKHRLAKQGIKLEYVTFNDYVQPDVALKDGQIDMHSCLTRYYFEAYNKKENAHLKAIGNTVISPLGLYSLKYHSLAALPDGATIAIPNEPTTLGRGLNLLQSAGLLKVKSTGRSG